MPQSSIKAHMRRLFEPEAVHLINCHRGLVRLINTSIDKMIIKVK